jgi:hypothetical protein
MLLDRPVGIDEEGPDGIGGDVDAAARPTGVLPLERSAAGTLAVSTDGRVGGAAPQVEGSGRGGRSLLKDPLPPLPPNEPREGGT